MSAPLIDFQALVEAVAEQTAAKVIAALKDREPHPEPVLAYLDTPRAAELLGVSRQRLEKLRITGFGPKFVKVGRLVRYRRSDLDEWLRSRERRNTYQSGEGA